MLRGKAGHGDVQAAMLAAMEERHVAGLIEVYANNFALRPTAAVGRFEGDVLYLQAMHDRPADAPTGQAWRSVVTGHIKTYETACRHSATTQPVPLAYIGRVAAERLDVDPTRGRSRIQSGTRNLPTEGDQPSGPLASSPSSPHPLPLELPLPPKPLKNPRNPSSSSQCSKSSLSDAAIWAGSTELPAGTSAPAMPETPSPIGTTSAAATITRLRIRIDLPPSFRKFVVLALQRTAGEPVRCVAPSVRRVKYPALGSLTITAWPASSTCD
nr:hypothetical protein [uncultured bacterium]